MSVFQSVFIYHCGINVKMTKICVSTVWGLRVVVLILEV